MWILPNENRKHLKAPAGRIFRKTSQESPEMQVAQFIRKQGFETIIVVGDVATKTLVMAGIEPSVAVVDGKTKRGKYDPITIPSANEVSVINPAGEIHDTPINEISKAIRNWLNNKQNTIIIVTGEEDLLTIPAVISSPIGAAVIYGQPNVGLVLIEITEDIQQKFQEILTKNFKRKADNKNG